MTVFGYNIQPFTEQSINRNNNQRNDSYNNFLKNLMTTIYFTNHQK